MSICESGVNSKTKAANILVTITGRHPLIKLAQALPWPALVELILHESLMDFIQYFINVETKTREPLLIRSNNFK